MCVFAPHAVSHVRSVGGVDLALYACVGESVSGICEARLRTWFLFLLLAVCALCMCPACILCGYVCLHCACVCRGWDGQARHVEYLEEASRVGEGGFGPGGVTFRGSTQKTVRLMQFAPTNLHLQEMRVGLAIASPCFTCSGLPMGFLCSSRRLSCHGLEVFGSWCQYVLVWQAGFLLSVGRFCLSSPQT